MRFVVGTVEEIPEGTRSVVEIAGRSVGVFNIQGEFFALRNTCPHQGGPLCRGRLTGFVEASVPGEYRYTRQGEILRCPWHGWEFDVKTGQSWWDPAHVRVRTYPVTVEAGQEGLQPGPYTAETYPVSVEEHAGRAYVVVHIPA
jgi:3-phenylpropionate/trans-cinnamate dioxygenase ferredoxin subunit